MTTLAFACPCLSTSLISSFTNSSRLCRRRRPRHASLQPSKSVIFSMDAAEGSPPDENPEASLFVDEDSRSFWEDVNVSNALGPLTEDEKETLRNNLPKRAAEFLIRRADDANRNEKSERSLLNSLDLPPTVSSWDDQEDEYKDYLYESIGGAPGFRRKGSSLFGGSDGLPDIPEYSNADAEAIDVGEGAEKSGLRSLFVGNVNSIDERAAQIGYSILALGVLLLLFKIVVAAISFFVSFTFSFFAIFALSAGIFVVFFVLRF